MARALLCQLRQVVPWCSWPWQPGNTTACLLGKGGEGLWETRAAGRGAGGRRAWVALAAAWDSAVARHAWGWLRPAHPHAAGGHDAAASSGGGLPPWPAPRQKGRLALPGASGGPSGAAAGAGRAGGGVCGAAAGLYRERGEAAFAGAGKGREGGGGGGGSRSHSHSRRASAPGSLRAGLAAAGWPWPPWRRRSPPPARR